MSTVHTTTNLRPYISKGTPNIDGSMNVYLSKEFASIAASLNAAITAMKALEVRIVAGGL
jgi:hypothetical protein